MYEKNLYSWADKISQHSGSSLEMLMPSIPANSHALCVSLMPADLRHRSHASRTSSHAWLTNLAELFFNTWLITKIKFNTVFLNPRMHLTLPQHTKISSFKGLRNFFWNLRQHSEVLRKLSGMFGNSRHNDIKTSRIWLKNSWQVYYYSNYNTNLECRFSIGISWRPLNTLCYLKYFSVEDEKLFKNLNSLNLC